MSSLSATSAGSPLRQIPVVTWLRHRPLALPGLFLLLVWLQLFLSLSPFWRLGTYYDYGWFVPLAAVWFFHRRWQVADLSFTRSASSRPAWSRQSDAALLATILLALALFLLLRIVSRYDVFWRPPRLMHVLVVCALHHAVLTRFLGWKLSAYFAPVTLFCLTAVPPPLQWEQAFVQEATRRLMIVSEPVCHLQGLPVQLSGSALTLDGEVLEIDEGCSGIRSFQSLFMTSLFVGELFLLGGIARLSLLVLGFAFAFLFNTLRVLVLTAVFFNAGEEAFHFWHDGVGMTTFALSALALLGAGRLFEWRRSRLPAAPTRRAAGTSP